MYLNPLLVVLLGVVTACGCNRPKPYTGHSEIGLRQRLTGPKYDYPKRDNHLHRDRSYDQENRNNRSQVIYVWNF